MWSWGLLFKGLESHTCIYASCFGATSVVNSTSSTVCIILLNSEESLLGLGGFCCSNYSIVQDLSFPSILTIVEVVEIL